MNTMKSMFHRLRAFLAELGEALWAAQECLEEAEWLHSSGRDGARRPAPSVATLAKPQPGH